MEPETLTAAPAPAPAPAPDAEDAPVRTCPTCGSGLLADQDWCLECGTARPDRLRGFPGARTAVAVLATSGVLASGAVAAAYAGLQGTPQPTPQLQASARTPGSTPPASATPQSTTPGATSPSSATPPAVTPPAAGPTATPFAPTAPVPGASPSAAAPAAGGAASPAHASGSSGASGSGSKASTPHTASPHRTRPSGGGSGSSTSTKLVPVSLKGATASEYNPKGVSTKGEPGAAIDGDKSTGWSAGVDSTQISSKVGLDLKLSGSVTPRELDVVTDTPGFELKVYGTTAASAPSSLSSWRRLADQRDVGNGDQVALDQYGERYRHLLVLIASGSTSDDHVALDELKLYR